MNLLQPKSTFDVYQTIVKGDLFIKKNWYIDFRLIKNFTIGYLYNDCINDETIFEKVTSFLKSSQYLDRYTDIIGIVFGKILPEISDITTMDHIYHYFRNINKLSILHTIPNTTIINSILNLVTISKKNLIMMDDDTMLITINLFPLHFNDNTNFILEEYFSNVFRTNVKVISSDPSEISFTSYDMIFGYDINEILRDKYFNVELEDNVKIKEYLTTLGNIGIVTSRITNNHSVIQEKSEEEIRKDFGFVEKYLNVFLKFSYISPIDVVI